MDTIGMFLSILIFFVIPSFYAFSFIKDPSPVNYDIQIDSERLKCESYIERRLYDALTFRGYTVRTQVPCGKYRIDLVLSTSNLAIECDGKLYHSSLAQKAHDKRKDKYLKAHGWEVHRFSGSIIHNNLQKVVVKIEEHIH
ncbi:endonuclease domain-containing protein [Virgibacillus siamensis]|uniref:endonuclease domain-containing protein n=1 Tax=Virgibacillus siamensis TaxID=480071 RepID=UPI001FE7D19D|nr:DUF559 domain-containing protein [Virgibacillus siamensis]